MRSSKNPFSAALRLQEGGLLIVILLLGLLFTVFGGSVKVPKFQVNADGERERVFTTNADGEKVPVVVERNKFLNTESLAKLLKDTSFIAIMAVGMTFVIISGGIDLSIAAIFALASVLGALVLHHFGPEGTNATSSIGILLGMLACVGIATVCGLFNGALIVGLKVHPFIITLGTMTIFRGIAFVVTNGMSVGRFPESFQKFVKWEPVEGLSTIPCLVMIFVAILGSIYLGKMVAGRKIYAVGGNEVASRYSGIRVGWVKLSVFIISGLTAGVAALMAIGYYGAATSGDGQGYELRVIASAVVGGASLTGGKGSAIGAVLGALVIQMIETGIVILGIDQNYSQIIIGAVVIIAVVLDQLNNWLAKKRLLKS